MTWPQFDLNDAPTPLDVATWVGLGRLVPDDVPMWAAQWLIAGYDGESLAMLAGLGPRDTDEIHELLPSALTDCGVTVPDSETAAARVSFDRLARMYRDGRAGPRWVVDKVCELLENARFADGVRAQPFAQLCQHSAEPDGRSAAELAAAVEQACREQLDRGRARPRRVRPGPSGIRTWRR
jgi:hypothetical protein